MNVIFQALLSKASTLDIFHSFNFFLLFPLMSVSVDFFLFLYFQDDLEYRCILMFQEAFVEYDQTITNNVVLALMIHQGTKIEHK
jgi:hypothetical protein